MWDSGLKIKGLECRVEGLGFRVIRLGSLGLGGESGLRDHMDDNEPMRLVLSPT